VEPSREEIEAYWEKLRELEDRLTELDGRVHGIELTVTRRLAQGLNVHAYNMWFFNTSTFKQACTKAFGDYCFPRLKALQKRIQENSERGHDLGAC
jgi:hypothetical protein